MTKYLKQHVKEYNRVYHREMLSDHFNVKNNLKWTVRMKKVHKIFNFRWRSTADVMQVNNITVH